MPKINLPLLTLLLEITRNYCLVFLSSPCWAWDLDHQKVQKNFFPTDQSKTSTKGQSLQGWCKGTLGIVYIKALGYTVKCFEQLVSQCFGDTVVGQVARNISQCDIPCNGQNRWIRVYLSCNLSRNDFGRCRVWYTVKCFVQLVPPQCRQNIARQVARNISRWNSAFTDLCSKQSMRIHFAEVSNEVSTQRWPKAPFS